MPKQRLTKRQQNEQRLREQQEEAARKRLLKHVAANPAKPTRSHVALPSLSYDQSLSVNHYPSGLTLGVSKVEKAKFDPSELDDEAYADYLAREAEAQKEIEVKKTRVAPMYNKGGYSYITDDMDPKQLGHRKL